MIGSPAPTNLSRRRLVLPGMDPLVPAPPCSPPGSSIRVFLCGDVMTGRGIDQVLPHPSNPQLYEPYLNSALGYVRLAERHSGLLPRPVDCAYIWGEALGEWARRRPHVRIVNLETSITTSDNFVPKGINYRMSPDNAACLTVSGADCCVLANNHVLDWGTDGLVETLRVLKRHGLKAVGAGRNAAEAASPAMLEAPGGARVIVAAFCTWTSGVPDDWAAGADRPGVNLIEPDVATVERLAGQLAPIRRAGDLVVASIHWGPNWGYEVPAAHRRFARALIERAGVSVVYGHSSHHPMAIEVHEGRLILYGCGDFLNDYEGIEGHDAFRSDLALMYFADLDPASGALAALEMVPLQIRKFRLNRPAADDVGWMRRRLDRECRRFGGHVRPLEDGLALSWPRSAQPALGGS
jgi:poly-gamma-glutamate capsule biosynthesis protein CapA/YwtB (metallophosphatase superfamily)